MLSFYEGLRSLVGGLFRGYFSIRGTGSENVPSGGPAILAGNHASLLDGCLLMMLSPRPVRFLVSHEFYFHPLLHALCKGVGCIPVYKSREHNGEALRAGLEALQRGEVIGIFPEGTTLELGRMETIKRGVGLLALKSGAPVVPFGIAGTAESFPPHRKYPHPAPLVLSFGSPLAYDVSRQEKVSDDHLSRTLEEIRLAVRSRMGAAAAGLRQAAGLPRFLSIAAAGLVVVPLSALLQLTSNIAAGKSDPPSARELMVRRAN